MSFTFAPAASFTERAGLFVSLTGGTNSGKTFSALRLARGIAGPNGKVAVLDTEGGRTLHLKEAFAFDANVMDPPFRPERFAQAALAAEQAGYDALVIDSFSMEWVGLDGVLDWQGQELQRMAGDDFRKQERMKMASWIKPKTAHKAMVYSLLQRRIPIIFSIRGEESVKPGEAGEKPTKIFKSVCNSQFPYEVTVSFRLETERKGYVDLSDPRSYKMEGAHEGIFRNGDRISEEHGAALAAWARGEQPARPAPQGEKPRRGKDALFTDARAKAEEGSFAYHAWRADLPDRARTALDEIGDELASIADAADQRDAGGYGLDDTRGEAA
ncbi:AAA family ATPase [Methylorubrum populi]|uniref:AAA family ATPase n=1 Tax=Methylorubrum populi TaxID=223967 RepID=UPI0031F96E56